MKVHIWALFLKGQVLSLGWIGLGLSAKDEAGEYWRMHLHIISLGKYKIE